MGRGAAATRTVPMDTVMQGSAEFVINIDADATVDVGRPGTPVRRETAQPPAAVLPTPAAPAPPPAPEPPTMPDPTPPPADPPKPMG